ncbi:thioredoxin-2 [Topomyia yanbarensis]|uniref:thioredoxin-2 n=1 Tax=Topomyia yanbarensis TaxID=2498891 RepID=UPI00273C0232|nr:thioredoxin-2 [Topomyia yanbarensis]
MVYTVKDAADFTTRVEAAGDKLVVVDFFATWCGPCKVIAPKLEELQNKYADKIVVVKVDVDECEDLAAKYEISSMPTFLFMKNNTVLDTFSGANAEKLEQYIRKHTE